LPLEPAVKSWLLYDIYCH